MGTSAFRVQTGEKIPTSGIQHPGQPADQDDSDSSRKRNARCTSEITAQCISLMLVPCLSPQFMQCCRNGRISCLPLNINCVYNLGISSSLSDIRVISSSSNKPGRSEAAAPESTLL
jgi:hypothetical protein